MQRSRLRRNQAVRKRSRVTSIKDLAQWQKLVNKLGDKLLVAHFFAVSESITFSTYFMEAHGSTTGSMVSFAVMNAIECNRAS